MHKSYYYHLIAKVDLNGNFGKMDSWRWTILSEGNYHFISMICTSPRMTVFIMNLGTESNSVKFQPRINQLYEFDSHLNPDLTETHVWPDSAPACRWFF